MRQSLLSVFCFLLPIFLWAYEPALGKAEKDYISKVLQIQGVTEKELGFEKKYALDSVFRLKVVTDLMDNPLKTPDYLDKTVQELDNYQKKYAMQLLFLSQQLDINIRNRDIAKLNRELDNEIKTYTGKTTIIFEQVENTFRASFKIADKHLKRAIKNLTSDEINELLMYAPVLWGDEDDSTINVLKGALHREFNAEIDTSVKVEIDSILETVQKLDRYSLSLSGCVIGLAVDRCLNLIANNKTEVETYKRAMAKSSVPEVKGLVYASDDTDWGKIVIGSEEDNVYYEDCAVIIDLGGNDVYKGRTASAIGILSSPFSICIDLDGDDLYDAPNKLFNFGTGIFGVGFLVDLTGNDVYKGFHNCLGAGFLGVGVLADDNGDDIYSSGYFSQGAGIFGVGVLTDHKGNDSYRAYDYCQGFSSTWGYGLLADFEGQDNYYTGGKYTHAPLLPNDYRSMCQGFSIGFRPIASGGIGFLYDKQGQDFYNASVYAQGTSYWYSLGMLYDGAGNDFYNASQYSQGAGIHLSIGILVDAEGDDHYYSRYGPAQGEGHDFAVGILIDKKGNDSYHASGGQGIGLTNSFGLFLDSEGNDIYTISEKAFGQGTANWSRGFGGIGLFLDLQGDDKYSRESSADNTSQWTQGVFGAGIDIKGAEKPSEAIVQEEPDTTITAIDEIFKMASLWEVGNARKKVRWARDKLNKRTQEAIEYIFKNKIGTKDGLELRAIEELANSLCDTTNPDSLSEISLKQMLYQTLYHKDRWVRSNAAYILGKMKELDAIDSLQLAYKQNRIRARSMIGAFEDIGDTIVVPIIIPYLKDKEEPTRIASARALAKIKDVRAIPALFQALSDEFFTVRIASETALVAIGDSSLKYLLTKTNDPKIIGVIATLGAKLDTITKAKERNDIQKIIISYLDNSEASIRLKAVNALSLFNDSNLKPLLQSKMAVEKNEFVLEKYKEVLKGFKTY